MSILLLDTNIVSFLLKGDTRAQSYASLLEGNQLAISFMTVAELFEWAAVRGWGETRRARLEQPLRTFLIIPADLELCRQWGTLRATQQTLGKTIASQDAWIAATALRHQLTIITHNPSDFNGIAGIDVRTTLGT